MRFVQRLKAGFAMRFAFPIVTLVLCAMPAGDAATEKERKLLEGTWLYVDAEEHGKKPPARAVEELKKMQWVFQGEKMTWVFGKGFEHTYSVNPSKKPKEMNLEGEENKG